MIMPDAWHLKRILRGKGMDKTERKDIFETLPVGRAVGRMAIPTIFGQIIILIYNMADTFYLGRTNNPFMVAGASLILPIFNITLSLAGLAGIGGGALVSRLLGEGRDEEAGKASAFSFYLALCMTAMFSLFMFVFMTPVLHFLGASDNTFAYARQYAFCVLVLGGVPTVLSNVCATLLRCTGMSKEAGFGVAMGGILNILLDPIFMFLLLPKGNEVLGVGIATLLSNCISFSYFLTTILRMRKQSVLSLSLKSGLPGKGIIRSVFNVGVPSAIATFLFDMAYVVIDKLMSGYGDVALAAVGIVLKVERLPLNVGIGICHGMMPLVAYNFSSKNHKRMREIIHFSIRAGLLVSAISIILYECFAGRIIGFFISDAGTVSLGTDFLRVRCLATPFMFMSFFTVYVFQGFGEGRKALFLGVMRWAVFNIPMLFLLNRLVGMYGIVSSQVCADILNVILSWHVYKNYMEKYERS